MIMPELVLQVGCETNCNRFMTECIQLDLLRANFNKAAVYLFLREQPAAQDWFESETFVFTHQSVNNTIRHNTIKHLDFEVFILACSLSYRLCHH